ncbi:MAG: type II secretion system protein [Opitutaceae bacterium]
MKINRINSAVKQSLCRGFTLIELLTVIATLGILVAILLPTFSAVRMNAERARTISDLRQVYTAVTLYASNNKTGQLPGPAYSGIGAGYTGESKTLARYIAPYLTLIPYAPNPELKIVKELAPTNYEDLANNYSPIGPIYVTNGAFTDEDFVDNVGLPFGYPKGKNPERQPLRIMQIPDPSRNVMFYALDLENLNGNPGWKNDLATRSLWGDARPFVYWDGHVTMSESARPEDDLLRNK